MKPDPDPKIIKAYELYAEKKRKAAWDALTPEERAAANAASEGILSVVDKALPEEEAIKIHEGLRSLQRRIWVANYQAVHGVELKEIYMHESVNVSKSDFRRWRQGKTEDTSPRAQRLRDFLYPTTNAILKR